MRPVARKTSQVIQGLGLWAPPNHHGGEGLETESLVSDLLYSGYIINFHKIPVNCGSGSSLVYGYMAVLGRWHD